MKRNSNAYIEAMEYIDNLPLEIQDYLYTVAEAISGKPKKIKSFLQIIKVNCPELDAYVAAQVLMDYYVNEI